MLRFLKHEVPNYFANMGYIHIYSHLTNQPINDICIYNNRLTLDRFTSVEILLRRFGFHLHFEPALRQEAAYKQNSVDYDI